jgi:hypothetical protein
MRTRRRRRRGSWRRHPPRGRRSTTSAGRRRATNVARASAGTDAPSSTTFQPCARSTAAMACAPSACCSPATQATTAERPRASASALGVRRWSTAPVISLAMCSSAMESSPSSHARPTSPSAGRMIRSTTTSSGTSSCSASAIAIVAPAWSPSSRLARKRCARSAAVTSGAGRAPSSAVTSRRSAPPRRRRRSRRRAGAVGRTGVPRPAAPSRRPRARPAHARRAPRCAR